MGGGDKCLIPIAGIPMLDFVFIRLKRQLNQIVINANGDPNRFAHMELPIVSDSVKGFPGPLAGILAGLLWIQENLESSNYLLTVASDTPFFPEDLKSNMLDESQKDSNAIVLASSGGKTHPVFGLWPTRITSDLKNWIDQNQSRKVMDFVNTHSNYLVEFDLVEMGNEIIDPFFNVNAPDDIVIAENYSKLLCEEE